MACTKIIRNLHSLVNSYLRKENEPYYEYYEIYIVSKHHIDVKKENGNLLLYYSDDGKGVDEKTRKRIFDPFYTTKRGSGGSGLGMHIVFNLVTQTLDGRIECRSVPDHGIQFEMVIPTQEARRT